MRLDRFEAALQAPARTRVGLTLAFAGAGVVAVADRLCVPELSCTPLYLATISLAAWLGGVRMGLVLAAMCAAAATISPLPLADGGAWNAGALLATFSIAAGLAGSLREGRRREDAQARTDALTGLLSRQAFLEAFESALAEARRTGRPVHLALMDVDGFRAFNGRFGFRAGDGLLRLVGETLAGAARGATLGRLEGDRFAAFWPDGEAPQDALCAMAQAMEAAFTGDTWPVRCRMAELAVKPDCPSAEAALERAERLLAAARLAPSGAQVGSPSRST